MRFSNVLVLLFVVIFTAGCGGNSSSSDSGAGGGSSGSHDRVTSLSLEPIEITEGREFQWNAFIDAPVGAIAAIEWEQISGVPVTILEGTTATLWADAPFVAEPQSVEMRVRATDDRGGVATATGTLTVQPYEPNYVALSPVVSLPPGLLLGPNDPFTFTTITGDALEIADDIERPMLVMADDTDGLALLSIANAGGGLLGEAQGTVEFSIDSTAFVLAVLTAGEAIPSLTTERVADIRGLEAFAELVKAIESLLRADKNFLQRMGQYTDLQTLVDLTAESFPPLVEPAATESLSTLSLSPLSLFASTQFNLGYGELKDGFYCAGWLCSPWHEGQAWNWFGTAEGAEVFAPSGLLDWATFFASPAGYIALNYPVLLGEALLPPFLAYSNNDRSLHALANPNFMNYAMEGYSGPAQQFWMTTPRNSTMIQKLRNSGAAMRTERAGIGLDLSPEIDRVRFQMYRFTTRSVPEGDPDHAAWISLVNLLNAGISAANLVGDFAPFSKYLESVFTDTTQAVTCAVNVFNTVDIYVDPAASDLEGQVQGFLATNLSSMLETLVSTPACLDMAVEGGKKLASVVVETKIRSVIDVKVKLATFGVKIAFDAVNDAAPVWTSFLAGPTGIDYYLNWSEWNGKPYVSRVTTSQLPRASFQVTQLAGNTIRLDGGGSSHDPSTALSYTWATVSSFRRDGWQLLGSGEILESTFPAPGEYIVVLTVLDGFGFSDYQVSRVTVRPGRLPSIESLRCSIAGNQLNMRLSIDDPDGRIESIRWFADSAAQVADLVTTPSTAEANLNVTPAEGGNWARVEILVRDSDTFRRSCWTEVRLPQNVAARGGDRTVTLTWNPVAGASHYNVYYATESGIRPGNYRDFQNGRRAGLVQSGVSIGDLANGTHYYFIVTAIVGGVESGPSAEITAMPQVSGGPAVSGYCGLHGQWDSDNRYCIGEYGHDYRATLEEASSSTQCGGYYKTYGYFVEDPKVSSPGLVALRISNGHCRATRQDFPVWPPESLSDHCRKHGGTGNYLWRYHNVSGWTQNTVGVQCELILPR